VNLRHLAWQQVVGIWHDFGWIPVFIVMGAVLVALFEGWVWLSQHAAGWYLRRKGIGPTKGPNPPD